MLDDDIKERLVEARGRLQDELREQRTTRGHWVGELASSALSTATAVSALATYLRQARTRHASRTFEEIESLIGGGVQSLVQTQNPDGGWGDTDRSYSNISTSTLVLSALRLADDLGGVRVSNLEDTVSRGELYVTQSGGIEAIRNRYGKDKTFAVPILTNAALAGRVAWSEVSALPFELSVLPQSWYRLLRMPVVSYAIPALVAVGQVIHHHRPSGNPIFRLIRNRSIQPSLKVLERMQPESGGFLEAIPLTSFVTMSLAACGNLDHPVVQRGIFFLKNSVRADGSWPIDTNLATWVTTLAVNALPHDTLSSPAVKWPARCWKWLLDCQHAERHPFTGAEPGGWGWSDSSGAVPDADDTPGALLALHRFVRHYDASDPAYSELKSRSYAAARAGTNWLFNLQNRDGGWPTFCRGWGALPFDRSGTDLTAHALRALLVWKEVCDTSQWNRSVELGWKYIERMQRVDGSWLPLWFGNQDCENDENPIYGTARVLMAYRDFGNPNNPTCRRGYRYLISRQAPDGSWGALPIGEMRANSSIEETALAVEALLPARSAAGLGRAAERAIHSGLRWLLVAIEADDHLRASPIGFYFAKLWYYEKLYPVTFGLSAIRASLEAYADMPHDSERLADNSKQTATNRA